MKKLLALLFALTFILAFASCSNDTGSNSKGETTSKTQGSTTSDSKDTASKDTSSKDDNSKAVENTGKEISFTLQNVSDVSFKSVTISEADKKAWSDNLITATIKSGTSATIKIKLPTTGDLVFDVQATEENGEAIIFKHLDLSEATDKGGSIALYISEGGGADAYFNPPYTEPTLTLNSAPTKVKYKVGEAYDPTGFSATYIDEDGNETKLGPNDVKFIVSKTVEITAGRAFTSAGKKAVVVEHNGLKIEFELVVE